ncbi:MAG TPA: F0F1 ATP synthase subunit A [Dehalococcoidia bacterium]|nr:F0F1 ATP synthase subunit A [Dehalococcoidia bacterium]
MSFIAAESIPGTHPTVSICSSSFCTFNYDTLISSGIAFAVTIAVAVVVVWRIRHGVPRRMQMVMELLLDYVRRLTHDSVARDADFVLPLAATIFIFIFVANWLDFLPLHQPVEPANADVNLPLAMALVVIAIVEWYSFKVLGAKRFFYRYTHPFDAPIVMRAIFVPINIITEIAKPVSLALRLFGNIFGGLVMVYLLTIWFQAWATSGGFFAAVSPIPVVLLVIWKMFDVILIGTIQAFIFMLLTVIYFGMAREGLEEEVHSTLIEQTGKVGEQRA